MARYKPIDLSPRLIPVDYARQILPASVEYALCYLIDHELDLSAFAQRHRLRAEAHTPCSLVPETDLLFQSMVIPGSGLLNDGRGPLSAISSKAGDLIRLSNSRNALVAALCDCSLAFSQRRKCWASRSSGQTFG